jgi:hypothetical protein
MKMLPFHTNTSYLPICRKIVVTVLWHWLYKIGNIDGWKHWLFLSNFEILENISNPPTTLVVYCKNDMWVFCLYIQIFYFMKLSFQYFLLCYYSNLKRKCLCFTSILFSLSRSTPSISPTTVYNLQYTY